MVSFPDRTYIIYKERNLSQQKAGGSENLHRTDIKIAIAGTAADTVNYVKYVASAQAVPVVTLEREIINGCDGLLLTGGGDITPAFYG